MGAPMKFICVLMFVMVLSIAGFNGVHGYGEYGPCGKHNVEKEAEKLEPCTWAAKDLYAPVSRRCCAIMEKKLKTPGCLCAIMFTNTARNAGIKPEIAVTIPKRCNIAVRPVGHKCGAFPLL
ncbi:hypothetical protein COLO4_27389 [Corchorus olitorius]|uniref:Bifunctional inhibitor/plant lipid transfer protein/seed storage helical domain-containing protein n=1 Tax=Corchorus olitorius TaxID=93759 RepID=A0A1R3HRB9_9ROSI|nr:hypothetical protein COLO4_27389 [Corchorus olitorius]